MQRIKHQKYPCLLFSSMSFCGLMLMVSIGHTASLEDIESRIEELERENAEVKQQYNLLKKDFTKSLEGGGLAQDIALDLENQMRTNMKISGYADVEYKRSSKDNVHPGFRIHHFSLFFTKNISDKWSLFSEIEYEDGPKFEDKDSTDTPNKVDASGKIFLEAMNVDFRWKPQVSFRVGRFFTPAGLWSVDHYPPFVSTQERPKHIRKVFPQLVDGALVFGRVKWSSTFFKYDVYTGNGEQSNGHEDSNSHKASGVKLALELPLFQHTEIGGTAYRDILDNGDEKTATGLHLKIQWNMLHMQIESASADFVPEDRNAAEYYKEGYYVQLAVRLGSYFMGVRKDYFDDYGKDQNDNDAQILTKTNTAFINYWASKDIVLKLEQHRFMPEDISGKPANNLFIAAIAVNLGN